MTQRAEASAHILIACNECNLHIISTWKAHYGRWKSCTCSVHFYSEMYIPTNHSLLKCTIRMRKIKVLSPIVYLVYLTCLNMKGGAEVVES